MNRLETEQNGARTKNGTEISAPLFSLNSLSDNA